MLPVHYLECCALEMLTNKLIDFTKKTISRRKTISQRTPLPGHTRTYAQKEGVGGVACDSIKQYEKIGISMYRELHHAFELVHVSYLVSRHIQLLVFCYAAHLCTLHAYRRHAF